MPKTMLEVKEMKFSLFFILIMLLNLPVSTIQAQPAARINIAHRGASGYLPEHTLAAKAMAYGQGADYIEQDLVLTKDDIAIVIHDIHLDTVTDVATKFPNRAREDKRFYAIDFTLAEIKTLNVNERIDLKTGAPVFPRRFPQGKSLFRISTFAEEIELIQGLNHSTGRQVGIYPEIKDPAFHRQEGKDISVIVLKILADYGYKTKNDLCYLQCFDAEELKRIRNELKSELSLIQLLEGECNIGEVAAYADGIGPWIGQIIVNASEPLNFSDMVKQAHENNLKVHPYTFRVDAPVHGLNPERLLTELLVNQRVDGIFSDFPDFSAQFFRQIVQKE